MPNMVKSHRHYGELKKLNPKGHRLSDLYDVQDQAY